MDIVVVKNAGPELESQPAGHELQLEQTTHLALATREREEATLEGAVNGAAVVALSFVLPALVELGRPEEIARTRLADLLPIVEDDRPLNAVADSFGGASVVPRDAFLLDPVEGEQ